MGTVRLNQEKLPVVTAIVPVYNHEKYVIDSLRSIIRQNYPNVELIVINDGSKDRSHEMVLSLVEECKQRFLRFEYINRENRGLSATLNQALEIARGKYLSVLASDDLIVPDKFRWLVEALEQTDDSYAAAFGNASFIDEHGRETYLTEEGNPQESTTGKTYSNFLDFYTKDRDFDYKAEFGTYLTLLAGNYLPGMSNLSKTAMVKEVGGWTDDNVLEDWEMWLKLSQERKFLFIDRTVALYRMHGTNAIRTMKLQMQRATLMLHARQREYCVRNGLADVWKDSFYSLLYWIVRYSDVPTKERLTELRYLRLSDILPLTIFLIKALHNRMSSKFAAVPAP